MLQWPQRQLVCLIGLMLIHMGAPQQGRAAVEANQATARDGMVRLIPVVTKDLESPVFLTHAGDGSPRLFVLEQTGRVRIVERNLLSPSPFLDIRDRVLSGGERGLLGLAFHPDFRRNGRLYVNYTRRPDGATVVAEYRRGSSPDQALRDERILMVVPQPYPNHNGGMVAFGPDGYLYVGLGDGGSAGDPGNRAQDPDELLGKILRIDVDRGDPYGVPPDNPYAREGGRPEIYALGLRNPWRFSFDSLTGDLWVADVGQHKWEEIDLVTKGGNYGWRMMEGTHCFSPVIFCRTSGLLLPLLEYPHEKGRCSIIGGYVYRGRAIATLTGQYLYGDYCSGEIFSLPSIRETRASREPQVVLKTSFRISSFGEDATGELYMVDHGGGIYRIAQP
jgi:glucose/arabinose dehydrogenase